MKTIEIRKFEGENRLFIDNQLFDWGIDEEAIEQINKIENKEDLEKINENMFSKCFRGEKTVSRFVISKRQELGQVRETF